MLMPLSRRVSNADELHAPAARCAEQLRIDGL